MRFPIGFELGKLDDGRFVAHSSKHEPFFCFVSDSEEELIRITLNGLKFWHEFKGEKSGGLSITKRIKPAQNNARHIVSKEYVEVA